MVKRTGILILLCVMLTGCAKLQTYQEEKVLEIAEQLLDEEKYEEATILYAKLRKIDPDALRAYQGLAEVFVQQEEMEAAVRVLKQGVDIAGELDDAEILPDADVEVSRDMRRMLIERLTDLGEQACEEEDYSKAIQHYKDLMKYDEQSSDGCLKLAEVYLAIGDSEQAMLVLESAKTTNREVQKLLEQLQVEQEIKTEYEELLDILSGLLG